MFTRLSLRHKNLTPLQKAGISFLLNWVIWISAWLIDDQVFFKEEHSGRGIIFSAVCQAICTTVLFDWRNVRLIFRK